MNRVTQLLVPLWLLIPVGCGSEAQVSPNPTGATGESVETNGEGLVAATGTATATPAVGVEEDNPCANPYREPNTDWRVSYEPCRQYIRDKAAARGISAAAAPATARGPDCSDPESVDCHMVHPGDAVFTNVPVWSDVDIASQFRRTRDLRYIYPTTPSSWIVPPRYTSAPLDFVRRISWLYPDNGCFARAEIVATLAYEAGLPKPFKLFSFGTLNVSSSNADPAAVPPGIVTWGWHVVPIVKSARSGAVYVLDAAIEPSRPLLWQDWLLRQVPSLEGDVWVTVAEPNAYYPSSPVSGGTSQIDIAYSRTRYEFLHLEWDRQVDLGRDPTVQFGDPPPWFRVQAYYPISEHPFLMVPSCLTCLGNDALSARCLNDCP